MLAYILKHPSKWKRKLGIFTLLSYSVPCCEMTTVFFNFSWPQGTGYASQWTAPNTLCQVREVCGCCATIPLPQTAATLTSVTIDRAYCWGSWSIITVLQHQRQCQTVYAEWYAMRGKPHVTQHMSEPHPGKWVITASLLRELSDSEVLKDNFQNVFFFYYYFNRGLRRGRMS